MSATSRPHTTLVSVTHDDAAHLQDFIQVVTRQGRTTEELQVVMVDIGSTDGTLDRLREWQAQAPELVTVLEAPGSSPAEARNRGLSEARGAWVSFPRPCDGFADNYLSRVSAFTDEHPDVLLVSANRLVADAIPAGETRDTHPLRACHRGDRPLDLDRVPEMIAGDPTSTFFSTEGLARHDVTFDDNWSAAPDPFALAWRLLLRAPHRRVGLMRSARYHQRRGVLLSGTPESVPRPADLAEDPTLAMIRRTYLGVLDEAAGAKGEVPEWLRHQVAYGFAHFYATNDSRPPVGIPLVPADRERFHDLAADVLSRLDVHDTVPHLIARLRRETRLAMQYGYRSEPVRPATVLMDHLDTHRQMVRFSYVFTGPAPEEEFRSNGETIPALHAKTRKLHYTGRHLLSHRIAWVRFSGVLEARLDGRAIDVDLEHRPFARRRVPKSVASWHLRPDSRKHLDEARGALPVVAESRLGKKAQQRAARRKWRQKYADAWVLMDRIHDASDSAEALFKYLRRAEPEVNAWFVLEEGTPHWQRLQDEGYGDRLVAHGSLEWRILMIHCAHLISTHSDPAVTSPPEIRELRLLDFRFTFLQHGVIMFDLSNWMNAKRIDTLVTSTVGEYRSIAGDESQYLVTTKEVALTGLPRWDRLLDLSRARPVEDRDLILVAPTWRKWLLPPIVPGSQRRPLDLSALDSDFFRSWQAFLTDERLEKLAADHGLKVGFIPHPNLQALLPHLDLPDHVLPLSYATSDIQELLSQARMMVTDYSSIAFDAAYINRPVTYFQFDTVQMLEGSHVGSRGYFDFDRDGFGPVATNVDDALRAVQQVIESGPEPMPEYAARMESTFLNRDGGCCARVVEAVRRSARPARDDEAIPTPPASDPWR